MNSTLIQTINAPGETVFDALRKVIMEVIARGEGKLPNGEDAQDWIGTTFTIPFPSRRHMLKYSAEITRFAPPGEISFRAQCKDARYTDVEIAFQVAEIIDNNATKTTLTCSYTWSTNNLFQYLESKLIGLPVKRGLRRMIQRLKGLLERDSMTTMPPRSRRTLRELWKVDNQDYRGLPVFCAPGTHSAAMELLTKHIQPGGKVLDLAAGSGAWLARLKDFGFQSLDAVELRVDKFYFKQIIPRQLDLNTTFHEAFDSPFRLVTALEIIEHLDCPRHFLRQVNHLVTEDGYLLLTTPNIGFWRGRLKFLLHAEHRHFGEFDYHSQRHISPVTDLQMRLMLKETGFRLIDSTTAGDYSGPLNRFFWMPLSLPFRIFFGPRTEGESSIYLVAKVASDNEVN